MNKKAIEHLRFIYDRLVSYYGEDKNSDFMIRFGEIVDYENEQLMSNVVKNDKKSSEISRDNEIKMQMATKMYCALLTGDRIIDGVTEEKVVDSFCEAAEQIFNRFNK